MTSANSLGDPKPAPSSQGRGALRVERRPISSLHTDPDNARRHDEANLAAIRASLAQFGQQKPIVVAPDGRVVAGNGTLDAARALGWTEIDVVETQLEAAAATAYAIADNRTAELAAWDDAKLSAELAKLVDDPDLQAATGFDPAAVDLLLSRVAQDSGSTEVQSAEQSWQGMPTFDTQDKTAFRQFTVHCPDHAAVELLAERLGIKLTERTRAFWFPPVEIETYADKRYTT